jgi:hypothetical protein
MAAVFVDIEKAFDTTWHRSLLYELSELYFSVSTIKLIISLLSNRTFMVTTEGEMSIPREMKAGLSQGSVLATTMYSLYMYDTPPHPRDPIRPVTR